MLKVFIILNGGASTDDYIAYKESAPLNIADIFKIALSWIIIIIVINLITKEKKNKT